MDLGTERWWPRQLPPRVSLVLTSAFVLGIAASALAQSPTDPRLAERDRLSKQVRAHVRAGRVEDAIADLQKALAIELEVYGDAHANVAKTLARMADLHERRGDFDAARGTLQHALAIRAKLHGADHWQTTNARLAVASLEQRARLTPQQRKRLRRAASLRARIARLYKVAAVRKCIPLAIEALNIHRRVLGANHPATARSTGFLAALYRDNGEYARAEPLCIRTVEIQRSVLGEEHPRTAWNLNALGFLYKLMGNYVKAEPLYRRALAIRMKQFGMEHMVTAGSLLGLANLYGAMGDRAQSEACHLRTLEIRMKVVGEEHRKTAASLLHLGGFYARVGEYSSAEPLLLRALEIWKKLVTEEHPHSAMTMNHLGLLYRSMGRYDEAEPLCRRALEIWTKTLGEDNPETVLGMTGLGRLYQSTGEHTKAEGLLRRALVIRTRMLGEDHPRTATSLEDLGALYESMGEHARAERLLWRALGTRRRLLDAMAAVQSERQQMRTASLFRGTLDLYIGIAPKAGTKPVQIYAPAMAWQGTVFLRQARMRAAARQPKLAGLFERYSSTTSQLATLSLNVPDRELRETWLHEIGELTREKEEIEKELSEKSAGFREIRDADRLAPAQLRDALPDDVVLVDFLEYARPAARHFAAFVVRKGKEIAMVDLGPAAPVEKAIDTWRASRGRREGGTLRRLLWDPLLPHLEGAGTVLLSPDGALGRLSFAGLPGKRAKTYLIEEVAIAIVPVAQMLPQLLRARAAEGHASLLLLGDVDYGGAAEQAEKAQPAYKRLSGTRGEILAIRDSFEQRHAHGVVTVLRRAKATESAFREQAKKHRWLHLATHGFFAPAKLRSAFAARKEERLLGLGSEGVVGYHPGLLSGLALAGANAGPAQGQDDGILTAVEVAALDLSKVEVAILSACETGLGKVAAGEGALGLQRAFQVSGARTTVTSLWKVPDAATTRLMQRFYENLWEKGMGKLAALREAQMWMLEEGRARGLAIQRDGDDAGSGRLPPHYWAAFVLAGDWR